MLVLIAVCFALVVSLGLRALGDYLQHFYVGSWPIIQFTPLLLVHGLAGMASWTGDPRTWGSRLMWMAAVHIHTVTYALNWPIYFGLANTGGAHQGVLPMLGALLLIIGPSILMFGGPIVALLNGGHRKTEAAI